jgi:RimJ/RimL family protein N-acetyltransferase
MVERFALELEREGWGLWAVEVVGGERFVGMVGLHRVNPVLPCAPAVEAAWRIHPAEWRNGYASEAAGAALRHGFSVGGLEEIVAFTPTFNLRSQSVMRHIGMVHDPAGDFDHPSIPVGNPLRRHVLYRSQPVHRVMA